jgi:hypothetical protein
MENEYMSLVFSIDKFRHPLLRHVPCQPPVQTSDYTISVPEFLTLRLPTIDGKLFSCNLVRWLLIQSNSCFFQLGR